MVPGTPRLSRDTYQRFVHTNEAALVLFDAPAWDVTGWAVMKPLFELATDQLKGVAALACVDVDDPTMADLCRSLPIINVPTVAYYHRGHLIAALIGVGQDVVTRTHAMIAGHPISYKDGRMLPDSIQRQLAQRCIRASG